MRNRWKNKQNKKTVEPNKPVETKVETIPKIETPKVSAITQQPIKKSFAETIKNDSGYLIIVGIILFTIITLSYTAFISINDIREPIIIKLGSVDNYSNIVRDECGYMYTPTNPPLTDAVTYSEKLKSTFVPIKLNESDTYSAELVSSKLSRASTFSYKQITNFKLVDPSNYIKKC